MKKVLCCMYKLNHRVFLHRTVWLSNHFCQHVNNRERTPANALDKIRTFKLAPNEETNRNARRVCLTVIGNGAVGQPRCLGMFTEFKCYLFNCGEGVMRLIREHDFMSMYIKHIFVTEKSWHNVSGLPDVYLSLQTYNVRRAVLHGPPGIEKFHEVMYAKYKQTKLEKRALEDSPFIDSTVEIDYVPIYTNLTGIHAKLNTWRNHRKGNRNIAYQDSGSPSEYVMSYICKVRPRPGDLSPQKCIEHGVPLSFLAELKSGGDVVLPSGKVIHSVDVHEIDHPGSVFLVVDCPHESMIDSFVGEKKFMPYQSEEKRSDVVAVFHFTPPHIVSSFKYIQWMNRFLPSTLHIILNSLNSTISSEVVHTVQQTLHLLHPHIFPLLHEKPSHVVSSGLGLDDSDSKANNIIQADAMLQLHIRPNQLLDTTCVVKPNPENYIENVYDVPDFKEQLTELRKKIQERDYQKNSARLPAEDYPEIVFLGTSSSCSTPHRNVSGILVNVSSDKSILLDCGEGTYRQLMRFYGPHAINDVLQRLCCIFISHHHVDHCMGLYQLIQARKEAFWSNMKPYERLALLTTRPLDFYLNNYDRAFKPLRTYIRKFPNSLLTGERRGGSILEDLKAFLGDIDVTTAYVHHCDDSHGIALEGKDWKIAYSGDAYPSQDLIEAGMNCTVLIHEASVEDILINEAAIRMHCTPSQVVEIAEKMNAQFAILTHFSKRYLSAPLIADSGTIGCSFDNMRVRLKDLPVLPLLNPVLKCLFQKELESVAQESSNAQKMEKVFFRSVKT